MTTFRPLIIAHRGNSSRFPENTLSSFRSAVLARADLVECDVFLSRDYQPVVLHDQHLRRLVAAPQLQKFTPCTRALGDKDIHDVWVDQLDLRQLEQLRVGDGKEPETYIPSLHTLLQFLSQSWRLGQRTGLLLEVKEHCTDAPRNARFAAEIMRVVNSCALPSDFNLIIQSFNEAILAQFLGLHKPLFLLRDVDDPLDPKSCSTKFQGVGINVAKSGQEGFVRKLKSSGLGVYVWTVDDRANPPPLECKSAEQVYTRLGELGVDGIITNFPSEGKAYLAPEPL